MPPCILLLLTDYYERRAFFVNILPSCQFSCSRIFAMRSKSALAAECESLFEARFAENVNDNINADAR